MRIMNKILAVFIWLVVVLMLGEQTDNLVALAWGLLFTMPNHLISHILAYKLKFFWSQLCVLIAMIAYFAWFSFVYYEVFYVCVDAQSAIALVFVGPYALIVLLPLWVIAAFSNDKHLLRKQQS